MSSQATLVYTIPPGEGASAAALSTALAAVPLPQDVINALACFVSSDTTSSLVRTIVLKYTPLSTATATANLAAGDPKGSPIESFTLTSPGSGYVAPPRVDIADPTGSGALGRCFLDVAAVAVTTGGTGYSSDTKVTFVGGLKPPTVPSPAGPKGGGVAATGHATIVLGVITAIVVDTPGSGYTSPPQIVITDDGGGHGAVAVAEMGLSGLEVVRPGQGYTSPVVSFMPQFKTSFPDGSDQRKPFYNLFRNLIQTALTTPVTAAAPVLS